MKIDVLLFTQTMASLLKSSLNLQEALEICSEIYGNKSDKKFCKELSLAVNNGNLLNMALEKYEKEFSPLYLSLVKIGENSGTLTQVFEKLSEYLKAKKEIKEKIIQCLIYPIVVLVTAILIVFIIMFYVLPRIQGIFEVFSDNANDILLSITKVKANLTFAGIMLLSLVFGSLIFYLCYKKSRRGSEKRFAILVDKIILKLPFIGENVTISQITDFSFAMKLLTSAYFPFTESMRLAQHVCTNLEIKKSVGNVFEKINQGKFIAESFEEEKSFPSYLLTWVKVAEKSGKTEEVFTQIYEYYSNETSNTIAKLVVSAEPVFILITGSIIISIIFQFVIPIFKMMGTL